MVTKLWKSKAVRAGLAVGLALFAGRMAKPLVAWAAVEGSYLYRQFVIRGPSYHFAPRISTDAFGIILSTNAYTGASQSGVPTLSGVTWQLLGPQTSAARTTCSASNEGQEIYDITIHSKAFCDGTYWHKLVSGIGAANDSWSVY